MVWARTSESEASFLSWMAATIAPLETPLQPQIWVSQGMAAKSGPAGLPVTPSAKARPKTRRSRMPLTSCLVAHQLQIPLPIGDIAIEHRAD